jgi:hypothetical protein
LQDDSWFHLYSLAPAPSKEHPAACIFFLDDNAKSYKLIWRSNRTGSSSQAAISHSTTSISSVRYLLLISTYTADSTTVSCIVFSDGSSGFFLDIHTLQLVAKVLTTSMLLDSIWLLLLGTCFFSFSHSIYMQNI